MGGSERNELIEVYADAYEQFQIVLCTFSVTFNDSPDTSGARFVFWGEGR